MIEDPREDRAERNLDGNPRSTDKITITATCQSPAEVQWIPCTSRRGNRRKRNARRWERGPVSRTCVLELAFRQSRVKTDLGNTAFKTSPRILL